MPLRASQSFPGAPQLQLGFVIRPGQAGLKGAAAARTKAGRCLLSEAAQQRAVMPLRAFQSFPRASLLQPGLDWQGVAACAETSKGGTDGCLCLGASLRGHDSCSAVPMQAAAAINMLQSVHQGRSVLVPLVIRGGSCACQVPEARGEVKPRTVQVVTICGRELNETLARNADSQRWWLA